jgi:hypothetical protein
MRFSLRGAAAIGAVSMLLVPAAAQAADQYNLSIRNDVGHAVSCGIRHAGSSAVDSFVIRSGEVWTKTYPGSKTRLLLCEGAYSISSWQPLASDRPYRVVKDADRQIVAQAISAR